MFLLVVQVLNPDDREWQVIVLHAHCSRWIKRRKMITTDFRRQYFHYIKASKIFFQEKKQTNIKLVANSKSHLCTFI